VLEVFVRSGKEAANLQDEIGATVLDSTAAAKQRSSTLILGPSHDNAVSSLILG